jgi:hypothetical protein
MAATGGGGDQRAEAGDLAKLSAAYILIADAFDLAGDRLDVGLQPFPFLPQPIQQPAQTPAQLLLRIWLRQLSRVRRFRIPVAPITFASSQQTNHPLGSNLLSYKLREASSKNLLGRGFSIHQEL